jgi:hypothetical protein
LAVAGAAVPPAVRVLGIVQPVEPVGVVVQAVGGGLSLVIALAMVASGSPLRVALVDDLKLLTGELHDLLQRLFEIQCFLRSD